MNKVLKKLLKTYSPTCRGFDGQRCVASQLAPAQVKLYGGKHVCMSCLLQYLRKTKRQVLAQHPHHKVTAFELCKVRQFPLTVDVRYQLYGESVWRYVRSDNVAGRMVRRAECMAVQ